MADFVFVPRGPFSLSLAADVITHFPPFRHQPAPEPGKVRIGFIADRSHQAVAVSLRKEAYGNVLHGTVAGSTDIDLVRKQVGRIFSLDRDATGFAALATRDSKLAPVLAAFEGLRPVSFTSPYECACWAIISQRIPSDVAAAVVRDLVAQHGESIVLDDAVVTVFPTPERLLAVESIAGLAKVKIERLHAIARAALEGKLDADTLASLSEEAALDQLRALPGIGPFWASAIWLRACGNVDQFPNEPIAMAALGALHGLGDHPAPEVVASIVERYRPFGMWVAFLLRVAAARGKLGDIARRQGAIRRSARQRRPALQA